MFLSKSFIRFYDIFVFYQNGLPLLCRLFIYANAYSFFRTNTNTHMINQYIQRRELVVLVRHNRLYIKQTDAIININSTRTKTITTRILVVVVQLVLVCCCCYK